MQQHETNQNDILITGGKRTGAETRREQNPPGTTNQHEKAYCKYSAYSAKMLTPPSFERCHFVVKI